MSAKKVTFKKSKGGNKALFEPPVLPYYDPKYMAKEDGDRDPSR